MKPTIVKVNIISPPAEEALLTVSDGHYSVEAYSQPNRASVGDPVTNALSVLFTDYTYRMPPGTPLGFTKGKDFFDWVICAEVVDRKVGLVRVGEITLSVDMPIPGDIQNGEIVELDCGRLDFVR